ncbi:MAG: hypothetical protein V3T05_13800 [Myxococcota bacterium]
MSHTPRGAAAMLLGACLLAAPLLDAFAGPDYDAIKKINDEINQARKHFPREVGGSTGAEADAMAHIEAAVAKTRAELTDNLEGEKAAYDSAINNLKDVESWLSHAKLSHACNLARGKILAEHGAGKQAGDVLFEALQVTIERFENGARPDAGADVDFWRAQVGKLRTADERVAAAAARHRAGEATLATNARATRLHDEAKAKLEILVGLNKAARPLTAQAISDLEVAARALEKVDPTAARFYLGERVRFAIEHHWTKPDTEAHEAIVQELGGLLVVAKGSSKRKKLAVRIKAKEDKCYLLLMHFDDWTGGEAVETFQWKMAGRDTALQEFHIGRYQGWKGLAIHGFCATHPAKVNAKAKLNFPGNKNSVRYLGLEFDRAAIPKALAAQLIMDDVDHCDSKAWTALLSDPVPGTLSFLESEPVIIKKA